MMNLDFGSIATTQSQSSNNYLHAWNIYENVSFDGVSDPISGTTQTGGTWKGYDFKFSSPEGSYSERIFEPTEKSVERRSFPNANGHDVQMPSDWERTKAFIVQVLGVYNPEGLKTLQEASSKIKNFDQMITLVKKLLENTTVKTSLKLCGRNSNGTVYAALPKFVRINSKSGECFTSDNFLGDKVAYSSWELGQKQAYESAKPTTMAKNDDLDVNTTDTTSASESDDLGDLIAGL